MVCDCIDSKQVTHDHDNHHCVKAKICTGMAHDHIDLRYTKHE